MQNSGLTVRQHEREGIEVPFELTVIDAHRAQLQFSPSSSALSAIAISGQAIDISSGGMGLRTRHFVPRMTEGIVRVFSPAPAGTDSGFTGEVAFEQRIKVRRVTLVGREPTYSLGVAFVDPPPELDQKIAQLFERMTGLMTAGTGAVAGGETHG